MINLRCVFGWLWAFPLTVIGLPVWLCQRCFGGRRTAELRMTSVGWVLIAHGALLAALLKHHPFGKMHAVAVGCCVFAGDEDMLIANFPHELIHARQAQQWGIFFPIAYLASSAWQYWHGHCAYSDNWFEKQANQGQN